MSTTTFLAHVPVNFVEIVDGPGRGWFSYTLNVSEELSTWTGNYPVSFRMKTPACDTQFDRRVTLTDIWTDGTHMNFIGMFGTEKIRAEYNLHTRKGTFSHFDNPNW